MYNWLARCVALAAFLTLQIAPGAQGAPADPNVIDKLVQPNGPDLRVHIWGDEFQHGYETTDGYSVEYSQRDDEWKYAERASDGELKPSERTARPDGGPAEAFHLRPTEAAVEAERADQNAQGGPGSGGSPAAGAAAWAGADTDILFLMVEFTDTGCSFTPGQMSTNMFGGGATGPGDLDDYFEEISYGKFEVVGNVVGTQDATDCIALANNRSFYNTDAAGTADDNRDDALVREAVTAADAYVDFKDYDNDNDGRVDALGIIYAGGGPHDGCATDSSPSGGDGDQLWPHSGGVNTGGALTADGKTIQPFIINSELTYAIATPPPGTACNQQQTIGLFAHELGHSLGLPDLYDTDVGNGGVHVWSTMASQYVSTTNLADTPPHYDPWSKAFQGWITTTLHQPGDRFTEPISQVTDAGEVHQFRDNPAGSEIGGAGEYFLVENRQQVKFDQGLPGCGLLVWHIDEAKSDNTQGGHTAAAHRLVDIDEADGLAELDNNGDADAGDPYPGSTNNRVLGDATTPDSKLYDGTSSNFRMGVQGGCASSMTAAFGPNQPPVADAGGPYTTDEGTDAQLTAAGSTDPDGDSLSYEWDLDNDGQYDDSTSQTPTFTDVGDNGTFTVGVRVTDSYQDSHTDTAQVTVVNVKPSVTLLTNDGPTAENTVVSINGLASDPGWEDVVTATVDWGDGFGASPLAGVLENTRPDATLMFGASHTYGDNGVYTVKVCAFDDDGATSDPCGTTDVTITNVNPTAEIDESGATVVNGVPTLITSAGSPLALTGRSTDPGSDDLTLTWDWADGSPNTSTTYLVNPPMTDPFPSPSIQPRDVTDTQSHAFTACVYDVGFQATDDDGGASPTDKVKVLIVGTYPKGLSDGYWQNEYRRNGRRDFDDKTLECYLQIVSFVSNTFNETRDASTIAKAFDVLKMGGGTTATDQLDRDLIAAWLNFANGAVGYNEIVDAKGTPKPFSAMMAAAEAVRNNPASTDKQRHAQRQIVHYVNTKI